MHPKLVDSVLQIKEIEEKCEKEVSKFKEASISLKRLGGMGDVIVHVIAYDNGISTREHEVKHENEAAKILVHNVRKTQKRNC